jgi:transcriptional regulator with XRE-family HTH domain
MGNEDRAREYFRKQVRKVRKDRRWSQSQLAQRLTDEGTRKYHMTTVAKIESGERMVPVEEASAIADVLGVPLDRLLGRNLGPVRDVAYVREALADAMRRTVDLLPDLAELLRDRLTDLRACGFPGVDAIAAEVEPAADKMAEAAEALLRVWPQLSGRAVRTEHGETVTAYLPLRQE